MTMTCGVSLRGASRMMWKTAIRSEAMRLYASGLSCRSVIRELKKSRDVVPSQESVHQWAKAAGILRTKSRADELMNARRIGRDFDAVRREGRRLRTQLNWSVRAIAQHLGVSRNVIKRVVLNDSPSKATHRRAWMAHHPDVEKRRADYERAASMRADGKRFSEIARAIGRPYPTIYSWFRAGARQS